MTFNFANVFLAEDVLDSSRPQPSTHLEANDSVRRPRLPSFFIRQISESKLLIKSEQIRLLDSVGQGKHTSLAIDQSPLHCGMPNYVKTVYLRNNYCFFLSGEFGVVYRGQLKGWDNSNSTELVAIKTLKGNN